MKRHLNLIVALTVGLLGGLLMHAQNQPQIPREIRAQSFTLVGPNNQTAGTFSVEPALGPGTRMRIVLRDANGREIWSAGGAGVQPLSER